jgi:hypothetical protein
MAPRPRCAGRFERWKRRQCAAILRGAIERLAAEILTVEWYDVAVAAYAEQLALSGPRHPRPALDRLMRRYIRHFRRELFRQHRFIEAAARWALMGAAA